MKGMTENLLTPSPVVACCLWVLTACLGCFPSLVYATENEITPVHAQYALSYETLTLSPNETMGLLGGSVLYDVMPWLSLGGAAYGAVSGRRGGFITLGMAADVHRSLTSWLEFNAGMFVGAGGGHGGYALQGGGLMLRSHVGVRAPFEGLGEIGAGISRVDFPNGSVHSTQPYFTYSYPFHALVISGWRDWESDDVGPWLNLRESENELAVMYRMYRIPDGVRNTGGLRQHPTIGLIGLEWYHYFSDGWFGRVSVAGAMQGASNGYMEILPGLGYRFSIGDSTWLKLSVAAGPAGGGVVDTGGGLLVDGQALLEQRLGEHLFVQAGGGYVLAPGGDFRARSFTAMLGYHAFMPSVGEEDIRRSDLAGFLPKKFRVRLAEQHYFKDHPKWRRHHAGLDVDLLGIQLDYMMAPSLYLTGQALAAYKGKAGGYMSGLLGVGVIYPLRESPISLEGEALLGAAGGGGLDVAGGLIWEVNAGMRWCFSDWLQGHAAYGVVRAMKGNFRARTATVSISYAYTLAVR